MINPRETRIETEHKYVTNSMFTARIISPDDENVKLTETMKSACEGKTIYYNSEHVIESGGEELKKGGVVEYHDGMKKFEKLFPQMLNHTTKRDERNVCFQKKVKYK